ncbi:transposase [Salmonella enterica subsp. enterica serovar Minnesota]|nr:transposase [Salmonella enterica subsp. enterica serovar Minnesota]
MDLVRREAWGMAWRWLCRARRHAPEHADIWHLKFHWPQINEALYERVCSGQYRLSPLHRSGLAIWTASDALVLKWVSLLIYPCIPVHENCLHVAGHHGGRDALRYVGLCLQTGAGYVYRTDIRGYYRHIRKQRLYQVICRYVPDPVLQDLARQYLYYSVENGGEFYTPKTGISRGCALSPLMGATLLRYVDSYFSHEEGISYVRYMDDFLFLSDRRWPVRRARMRLLEFFDAEEFECHADKTQCGRVARGFDWLGVWFTDQGATGIAPRALQNHRERRLRLEELSVRRGLRGAALEERMQRYDFRWKTWAEGQLRAARLI